MTTIADLVAATPAATRGVPAGFPAIAGGGTWRHVLELADPSAGSSVEWFDITDWFTGYEYTRGADAYLGRYRASIATLDLFAPDDRFAPWNGDTSGTFGVHVDLGPGLLVRSGFIRVDAGVVEEWNPRFTCKVEFWGDASYSQGKIRQHRIVARDTLTSLVGVPIPADTEENWSNRVASILTAAGWPYGSTIYGPTTIGGVGVLPIPDRDEQASAINELDATLDPAGAIWFTNRKGQLIVRPSVYDTWLASKFDPGGAAGTPYPEPDTTVFAWWACTGEEPPGDYGDLDTADVAAYAMDTPGVEPFGLDRTELSVVNHVVVVSPGGTFDEDDPTSIQRFDRHTLQASWITANDFVAADILAARANATIEAKPITANIRLDGFQLGPSTVDYTDRVEVWHRNGDAGMEAHASGWLRAYRERVRPVGCDTDWTIEVTLDVFEQSSRDVFLLPVVGLTLTAVTDLAATFAWSNPTQVVTPTHTQVRMNGSPIWLDLPYPITGITWSGLAPYTPYEFEVRLIRVVDGLVTHYSPVRSVVFITDEPDVPIVDVDPDNPDDGTVTFPPPDPDDPTCILEWELQESADGETGWTTIDDGTITVEPYVLDYDLTTLDPDMWYRFRSREVCGDVPGAWMVGDPLPFVGCLTVSQLGVPPFDDADLVAYWPQVCADRIEEAVSDEVMTFGPAFDRVGFDGAGLPVMVTFGEGVIGYGTQPVDVPGSSDLTIACRVRFSELPDAADVIVFAYGGLYFSVTASGSGYTVDGHALEAGVGTITISAPTVLDLDTEYTLTLTHDVGAAAGLKLFIDANLEEATVSAVGDRSSALGGLYQIGAPADSWVTDCGVWDKVLAPTGPGPALPAAILALSPTAYYKLDDASGGATDSSGNARHGTYIGTHTKQDLAGPDGGSYVKLNGGSIGMHANAAPTIGTTPGLTIFCIVRPDSSSTGRRWLVTRGTNSSWEWWFYTDTGKLAVLTLSLAGGMQSGYETNSAHVTASQWNVVACRVPSTTQNADLDLYANDATERASTIMGGSSNLTVGSSGIDPRIGDTTPGLTNEMIGHFAHVAIFAGEVDLSTVFAAAQADGWF